MKFRHLFRAKASWHLTAHGQSKTYSRSHTIEIEGKPTLDVSAAKAFKGDPQLYNPEDMLLASLMSCHMMSYLYVCSKNNIEVIKYSDEATATLVLDADGSGRITEVILNPIVLISDPTKTEAAMALHKSANELCFIANSCNFPVLHRPVCFSG